MLAPDAGSVMVGKVRFCGKRILRDRGTAFASTHFVPGQIEDAWFAQGTQTNEPKPACKFVTHVRRIGAHNEDDFTLKVAKHHELARTLQGY